MLDSSKGWEEREGVKKVMRRFEWGRPQEIVKEVQMSLLRKTVDASGTRFSMHNFGDAKECIPQDFKNSNFGEGDVIFQLLGRVLIIC